MDVQVEQERLSPFEISLKVTVPAAVMTERVDAALAQVAHNIKLPGFRQGHIPRRVLIERFGKTITGETVQDVLQEAYRGALAQAQVEPVSPGDMTDIDYQPGAPLSFNVAIEVMPDFALPELGDVTVELLQPQVTEDDALELLDVLRESHAVLAPSDDPTDARSVIRADLQELDVSGLPIVGRVQRDVELDLSRVQLGGNFAEKIAGLRAGQSTVVELPGRGGEESKPTRFAVTVNSVQRKELPPVDDELARMFNPNFSSLDELKTDLVRYLEARAAHQARERMFRAAADELLRRVDFAVPPRMLDEYLERLFADGLRGRKETPSAEDKQRFKEQNRAATVWNLRWFLLRKRLVADRQLEVSAEDYQAELLRLAQIDDKPPAEFEQKLTTEQADQIREDLLERKVLALLHAEIQTVPRPVSLADFEGRAPGRVVTV